MEFENIIKLITEGKVKTGDVIRLSEKKLKDGEIEPEIFSFTVKFMNLLDRINKNENELINIEELVDLGLYDSVDDVKKVIDENYDDFKDCIFSKIPCAYPEPTEEEINQCVDSDNLEKVCITCFHRRRHVFCVPCGHAVMCTVCCKNYVETSNSEDNHITCPVCRKQVNKFQKIFL